MSRHPLACRGAPCGVWKSQGEICTRAAFGPMIRVVVRHDADETSALRGLKEGVLMTDRVDKKTRSKIMSAVKGSDTTMELAVRPTLESLGFEYHPKGVFGSPDFAHMDKMVAVFLDGCFFHGCPEHYRPPSSSADFWAGKVKANRARDAAVTEMLEGSGWRVIRVWEHGLKAMVKENKAAVRAIVELGAHLGKVL